MRRHKISRYVEAAFYAVALLVFAVLTATGFAWWLLFIRAR